MGFSSLDWLRAVAVSALAITNVASSPLNVRAVLPPSQDPFYIPPNGYASQPPGTILRNRTIDASFLGILPNPVQGYQLLFRTNAINGTAIAGVTTIFKPLGAATDKFVSFQTAYDSSASKCDPSYTYRLGTPQTDLITSVEELILESFIGSGYIVSAPDYEGPDAAFSPGHLEGTVVLDSMRATTNFAKTLGFSTTNPSIVGYGYSGGAIATGWAASIQPKYASALPIKGWAAGGTPANLTGTLLYIDNTTFSGFLPAAFAGLLKPSAYKAQLQGLTNRILTPFGRKAINYAETHCAQDDIMNFSDMSVLSTKFQSMGPELVYNPTLKSVMDKNIMGIKKSETPTAPVYLFHASQDEIIPYTNATTLYKNWCKHGAPSVQFVTYGNGGHATTEALGVFGALDFVSSAFAGTVKPGCSMSTTLNSTLNPLALGVELEPVLTGLLDALNMAGEKDSNLKSDVRVFGKTVSSKK